MADHLAAPTALEEHRKLEVFAGEWAGEEMVYPSRWTAGGPAISRVVAAVKEVGLKVPLVVRLEGTNVDAGKKIIRESGLNVLSADNLDDAAQKIVKAVKGG